MHVHMHTSSCSDTEPFENRGVLLRRLLNLLMGHIKGDLQAMEAVILAEADWLDYTIIRPPHLVPVAPT